MQCHCKLKPELCCWEVKWVRPLTFRHFVLQPRWAKQFAVEWSTDQGSICVTTALSKLNQSYVSQHWTRPVWASTKVGRTMRCRKGQLNRGAPVSTYVPYLSTTIGDVCMYIMWSALLSNGLHQVRCARSSLACWVSLNSLHEASQNLCTLL